MTTKNYSSLLRTDSHPSFNPNGFKPCLQNNSMNSNNSSLLRTDQNSNGFKLCFENNSMNSNNSSLLRTANNTDTASFLRCRGET